MIFLPLLLIVGCSGLFGGKLMASERYPDSIALANRNEELEELIQSNPDSAVEVGKIIIEDAIDQGIPFQEGNAYILIGRASRRLGNYEQAIQYNEKAISLYSELADSLMLAQAYRGLGGVYGRTGEYMQALDLYLKCMHIQERNKASEDELATTYNQLGTIFGQTEESESAITYYEKALKIWETGNQKSSVAISYLNIGSQHILLGNDSIAEAYLKKSKSLFDQTGYIFGGINSMTSLGQLYLLQERYSEAYQMILPVVNYHRKQGDKGNLARALSLIGEISFYLNKPEDAVIFYEEALELATKIGRKATKRQTYIRLAKLNESIGRYEDAFKYMEAYSNIKDTLLNESTTQQLQQQKAKYETEQKDREIQWFKERADNDKKAQITLIIGLVVFSIASIIILIALRSARKLNQKLREEKTHTQALLQEKEALVEVLENTKDKLVQNDKMASLGQLTAGVAHEINNPINFISANIIALRMDYQEILSLLKKVEQLKTTKDLEGTRQAIIEMSNRLNTRYLSAEINQLIAGIERGVKRTKNIVKSLSIFSRNTSEEFIPADINEGLNSTLTLLKSVLGDSITVETKFELLPEIDCQISPLNQVFLNIISNAAQAIDGEGTITIKTWQEEKEVKISISDTGKGMSQDILNRIFEPFFTTKEVGQGTGLGLSISYGIIQEHNGNIEVMSQPDIGSTFTITLPINRVYESV